MNNTEIPQEFAHCRVYGHRWDSVEVEFDARVIFETLICMDCSVKRTDKIERSSGLISSRSYKYPDGYLRKGAGQIGTQERGQLRLNEFYRNPRNQRHIRTVR